MPEKELPYRKKIFDFLTEKFSDFRLNEQDFYNKIDSDDGYSDKVFTVISDKFSDFTKGKDDFIGDLKKKKILPTHWYNTGLGKVLVWMAQKTFSNHNSKKQGFYLH